MLRGTCLDSNNPHGMPDPRSVAMLGFNGARIVAFSDDERFPGFCVYGNTLLRCEMQLAVALASESFATGDYEADAREIASAIAPTCFVIGNEQDAGRLPVPSPSSWSMEPFDFAQMFTAAARGILSVRPEAQLIIGGFVAGDPSALGDYIAAIRQLYGGPIDGYDVHAYAKTPAEVEWLLGLYREYAEPGMKAYSLEWNRSAEETADMVDVLDRCTYGWCHFCWDDLMVPDHGLCCNGWPKIEARAIARAL